MPIIDREAVVAELAVCLSTYQWDELTGRVEVEDAGLVRILGLGLATQPMPTLYMLGLHEDGVFSFVATGQPHPGVWRAVTKDQVLCSWLWERVEPQEVV